MGEAASEGEGISQEGDRRYPARQYDAGLNARVYRGEWKTPRADSGESDEAFKKEESSFSIPDAWMVI